MTQNKLYYGDNLDVLRKYVRDGTVDLCYIDPPFNSKRNYNQIYNNIGREDVAQAQAFVDTWTWDDHANDCLTQILDNTNGVQTRQSQALIKGLQEVLGKGSLFAYLVSMTVRIAEIHRTLKPTGSFYLHCDPTASHYLKLVCDAIFASQGGDYKNEVIWKRASAHNDPKRYGNIHDNIFFYTKSQNYVWNPFYTPYTQEYIDAEWNALPDGRMYKCENMLDPQNKMENYDFMGTTARWRTNHDGMMAHWNAPQTDVPNSHGRIKLKRDGTPSKRCRIIFLDEMPGVPLQSMWNDIHSLRGGAKERLGYGTQKPQALLERIIAASSNEGDTILDAYCGCGTTVAVAQRLKRNWIGIDITYQSISLILKRLRETFGAEITNEIQLHGIPRDMESVRALVHKKDDRVRKEFEKWAVLTYSDNRAVINEKKGADRGIDGVAYVATGRNAKGEIATAPIIFSVKSGKTGAKEIRDLRGTIERETAAAGILITLEDATEPMRKEAKQAGQFKTDFATFDRLQIVTVQEILDGARLSLPMYAEVVKKARSDSGGRQTGLAFDESSE